MFEDSILFEKKLVKQFFLALDRNVDLRRLGYYQNSEERTSLINRASKIIQCKNEDELDIDEELFIKIPVNSSDPLHIAADCFKDVLRECCVPEDKADLARRAFICLRQNSQEDVRDRLLRIASCGPSKK